MAKHTPQRQTQIETQFAERQRTNNVKAEVPTKIDTTKTKWQVHLSRVPDPGQPPIAKPATMEAFVITAYSDPINIEGSMGGETLLLDLANSEDALKIAAILEHVLNNRHILESFTIEMLAF